MDNIETIQALRRRIEVLESRVTDHERRIAAIESRLASTVAVPVLPTTDAGKRTPQMCSFGCGRVATETANGEPVCGDGDACIAAIPLKPAPTAVDVLGSELRVGDVVVGGYYENGFVQWEGPTEISLRRHGMTQTRTYRVRLPRPTVEPSAKAKCPTCRCMITPGSECACCVSTSGEYPPLPSLDLDDAEPSADEDTKRRDPGCECVLEEGDSDCPVHPSDPETGEPIGDWHRSSASGEGIARSDHLCITVAYGAGSYTWTAHNEGEASTIEAAINAAHVNATRELRARCERAERGWDQATGVSTKREIERNEIYAELENTRHERDEAQRFVGVPPGPIPWCPECGPEPCCDEVGMCSECGATVGMVPDWRALKNDCDAAVKRADLAERVVEAARDCRAQFSAPIHRHAEEHALSDALNVYDAARKDGGK